MTISELKAKLEVLISSGTVGPDDRIDFMDEVGEVEDQLLELGDRIAEIPEPAEA